MIDNPYEQYPWEDSPRDKYQHLVLEDIESEMYHYDEQYIQWLTDAELLPTDSAISSYCVDIHPICDLLTANQKIRDAYYLYREEDVFARYIYDD